MSYVLTHDDRVKTKLSIIHACSPSTSYTLNDVSRLVICSLMVSSFCRSLAQLVSVLGRDRMIRTLTVPDLEYLTQQNRGHWFSSGRIFVPLSRKTRR